MNLVSSQNYSIQESQNITFSGFKIDSYLCFDDDSYINISAIDNFGNKTPLDDWQVNVLPSNLSFLLLISPEKDNVLIPFGKFNKRERYGNTEKINIVGIQRGHQISKEETFIIKDCLDFKDYIFLKLGKIKSWFEQKLTR